MDVTRTMTYGGCCCTVNSKVHVLPLTDRTECRSYVPASTVVTKVSVTPALNIQACLIKNIWACRQVQDELLQLKPSSRIRNESSCDGIRQAGFRKLDFSAERERKHPENSLMIPEVRGEWADWQEMTEKQQFLKC